MPSVSFEFIVEELQSSRVGHRLRVKPMFGSHALYVDDKIYFILRHKDEKATARDNGVWVVLSPETDPALLKVDFPSMREIEMFNVKGWLNLPESSGNFEESALQLCALVLADDPRLGKVTGKKAKPAKRATPPAKKAPAKKAQMKVAARKKVVKKRST